MESWKPSGSLEIHVSIPLPRNQWNLLKLIGKSPEDYQTQTIWLHLLQIQSFIHGSLCSSYTNPTRGNYKKLCNKYAGESLLKLDITYLQLLRLFLSFSSLLPPYFSPFLPQSHSLFLSFLTKLIYMKKRVRDRSKTTLYISHRIYFQHDYKNARVYVIMSCI